MIADTPKFQLRDRVCRRSDVYDQCSRMRFGRIAERYSTVSEYSELYYSELYAVKWEDTGLVEHGFLPHGLQPAVEDVRR